MKRIYLLGVVALAILMMSVTTAKGSPTTHTINFTLELSQTSALTTAHFQVPASMRENINGQLIGRSPQTTWERFSP